MGDKLGASESLSLGGHRCLFYVPISEKKEVMFGKNIGLLYLYC